MKRNALAISLLWFAASLIGCTKRSDQSTTAGAQQAASGTSVAVAHNKRSDHPSTVANQFPSQMEQAVPQPVVQTQPQPFTFHGVHAGMTVAELKAVQHRNQVQCVNSYGGPRHNTPVTECAFDDGSSSVSTYFFREHIFYIVWGCKYDDCPSKAIAAMKAHYGKQQSSREEIVPAEVGAFREHVTKWRSPQETASIVGDEQFEVMNYDFAPPDEPRQ